MIEFNIAIDSKFHEQALARYASFRNSKRPNCKQPSALHWDLGCVEGSIWGFGIRIPKIQGEAMGF